jgi:protein-S-isoprenylcysteine O-methyltransferase Ste14
MTFQLKLIIFILASVGITWVSRSCLREIRSHGFYRFFAFESILVLILLNLDRWFHNPFSVHQVISWILLTVCTVLVVHGVLSLYSRGKPQPDRDDPTLLGIEKTTELVTEGAYRYIRHPLYSSLLFLTWGAFFKAPSAIGFSLALIATFFLTMTARIEETENICFFGEAYESYMKQTKMFIPYLF